MNETQELHRSVPTMPGYKTNDWVERRYPQDAHVLAHHWRINLHQLDQLLTDERCHDEYLKEIE